MTTERPKWWRAFLPRKKSTKDGSSSSSSSAAQSFEPDFDPFRETGPASSAQQQQQQQEQQEQQESSSSSTISSSDTYDDSKLESVFNEHTCRRKLLVSRSGRFKERGKKRANLPIQHAEGGEVP